MSSFLKLWESMMSQETVGVDQAAEVIKTGMGFDQKFWSNFILLLNNSQGLAELLGVSEDNISTWYEKINSKIAEVQKQENDIKVLKNKKLIKTGISGENNDD